jgi:hypothetical protein
VDRIWRTGGLGTARQLFGPPRLTQEGSLPVSYDSFGPAEKIYEL